MKRSKGIYRFVNYFDLYNLLKHKKIRYTKLSVFVDKNEGFGSFLKDLELTELRQTRKKELFEEYKILKATTYVSCWSLEPDIMAMWLLYSQDSSSFRIETTQEKFKLIKDDYNLSGDVIPERFASTYLKNIEMKYRDLIKAKKQIENKNRKFTSKLNSIPNALPKSQRTWKHYSILQEKYKDLIISGDPLSYKDKAYTYEKEIRSVMQLEPVDEDTHDYLYSGYFDLEEFPDNIYLKLPENFIKNICIDPRCPRFKKIVYTEFIKEYDIPIVESDVFGAIPII